MILRKFVNRVSTDILSLIQRLDKNKSMTYVKVRLG
jgi:hypothetical protein